MMSQLLAELGPAATDGMRMCDKDHTQLLWPLHGFGTPGHVTLGCKQLRGHRC